MQRDLNLLLVKPNELPKKITIKNTLKENGIEYYPIGNGKA